LLDSHLALWTTELVLAELHALALARSGPAAALASARKVTSSGRIAVVSIDERLREEALALLEARPGRDLSLADAVSLVVMREEGLGQAFTLDRDFAAEGHAMIPAE
jgi:predicted nucleic acid-binding protein